MPLYEFKCMACGKKFEKLVFHEEEVRCQECGGGVQKLISSFSYQVLGKVPKGEKRVLCSKCQ